ncbi:carbohydrate-binding module family 48 protein [Pseudocercospora fijiensis CIRAD86]|uniref:Carbohydrate-binding module family 48 protein n=1 Tax=Pseudocercospora fijiensis (strain CIRAD86) TaxID=383855 RepID=M2Z057_PSEFD|nr:carbohydrate-binding module family 48 protein [Pseudocercospora fijiensis CIRAD86]EME83230.1 carbohydrate-binding module family 48 protein [Pseudocercospora fijiensis CIRAD86]
MGSYNFRWGHRNDVVYVTGTFDNWSKSVKLDKKDQVHEKRVNLPQTDGKIYYKFVADGEWKHDHTAKTETDHEGNVNNVLSPDDLGPIDPMADNVNTSSVAPGATTTDLAGKQPLEKDQKDNDLPGAFPETPAATAGEEKSNPLGGSAIAGGLLAGGALAASGDKKDEQTFSVNPIPASSGAGNPITLAPGEKVPDPSTINSNTISSTVRDDPSLKSSTQDSEQTVGVAPLPATGGAGNPVHLQPGEPVPDPSTITRSTVDSNVKLDKESYEKSDAAAPVLPATNSSSAAESAAAGGELLGGLGPQTTNMIPESSMGMGKDAPGPMDGAAINSVGATSTTNELAGKVPLEPRGGATGAMINTVGENSTTNALAGQVPLEAKGIPEVVAESQKEAGQAPEAAANPTAVEEKKEVEEELKKKVPEEPVTSDDSHKAGIAGAVAGGVAAAAVAVNKTKEATGKDPTSVLPESVQSAVDEQNAASTSAANEVPAEVKDSQKQAHAEPEASGNPEAVHEKSDVEKELLSKVPESQASGEPAPTVSAATASTAPTSSTGAPQLADPTAGVAALSLDDKSKDGLNASADSQAQSQAAKPAALAAEAGPSTTGQSAPEVTTGVDSGKAPAQSTPVGTPRKKTSSTPGKRNSIIDRLMGTPDSQKTADSAGSAKKKGLFSRIKDKLKQ